MVDYLNPFNPDEDENGKNPPGIGAYTPPATPAPTPAPAPKAAPKPIIGRSGFNYTDRWGVSADTPKSAWTLGERPPSVEDWLGFSPEEQGYFGITDMEAARQAWQAAYNQSAGGGGAVGGGGGGGGGGSARSSASSITGPDAGLSAQIRQMLSDLMSGKLTAYTPEVMANSLSKLKRDQAGSVEAQTDIINQDALRRGIFRSGIPAESIAAASRGAASDYAKGAAELENQKAISDISIRMSALDDADAYITRRESALLQSEQNDLQRTLGLKGLELEKMRIAQQRELLQMQLDNALNLAELNLLATGLF